MREIRVCWDSCNSDHVGDTGLNGRIILKLSLKQEGARMWGGLILLRLCRGDEYGDKAWG